MRMLSRSVICCIAITACSTDPPVAVSPPEDLGASLDRTTASWSPVQLTPGPNYVSITATALNNRGHIVGYEVSASRTLDAFVQRLGQRRYLKPFAGHSNVRPTAINDLGVVTGVSYSNNPLALVPVYYWDSELPSIIPGISAGVANDVSESGWVVGNAEFSNPLRVRGFIWRPGWPQARILGDQFPASVSQVTAVSVNNFGHVSGNVGNQPGVWILNGTFEPIPLPDTATGGFAGEINDAGQVVGTVVIKEYTPYGGFRGFLWSKGQPMLLLHSLPGLSSFAGQIDRRGRVFGILSGDYRYPAVWSAGDGWLVLWDFISVLGGSLHDANDCGMAVGSSIASLNAIVWLTEC